MRHGQCAGRAAGKARPAVLEQDVLSRDAEIRGAVLYVGRRVRRAHDDRGARPGAAGADDELPGDRPPGFSSRRIHLFEQRQRLVENPAFGRARRSASVPPDQEKNAEAGEAHFRYPTSRSVSSLQEIERLLWSGPPTKLRRRPYRRSAHRHCRARSSNDGPRCGVREVCLHPVIPYKHRIVCYAGTWWW